MKIAFPGLFRERAEYRFSCNRMRIEGHASVNSEHEIRKRADIPRGLRSTQDTVAGTYRLGVAVPVIDEPGEGDKVS
ncbi:hypothetical protein [Gordonia metallireducens]|uniref:hypothetical protein n=1 Tax=Gordonia metallireducens TaxID=2897779 RepID=UPI001E5F6AE7|nr:hypothetical protein [Gordonia metallireducens]